MDRADLIGLWDLTNIETINGSLAVSEYAQFEILDTGEVVYRYWYLKKKNETYKDTTIEDLDGQLYIIHMRQKYIVTELTADRMVLTRDMDNSSKMIETFRRLPM